MTTHSDISEDDITMEFESLMAELDAKPSHTSSAEQKNAEEMEKFFLSVEEREKMSSK